MRTLNKLVNRVKNTWPGGTMLPRGLAKPGEQPKRFRAKSRRTQRKTAL
jgi:hypothetical protein